MDRRRYHLEPPTFGQTIAIIRSLPTPDLEAIKREHLARGFTYDNQQIHNALAAIDHRSRSNLRSGQTRARTTRR